VLIDLEEENKVVYLGEERRQKEIKISNCCIHKLIIKTSWSEKKGSLILNGFKVLTNKNK